MYMHKFTGISIFLGNPAKNISIAISQHPLRPFVWHHISVKSTSYYCLS